MASGKQLLEVFKREPQKNREQIQRIEQVLAGLQHPDESALRREARVLAQRVVDEFANVRLPVLRAEGPGHMLFRRDASVQSNHTYGEKARALLFEVDNLVVGRKAPEIEGRDAEGKALRLSDFRGKVVVLMFSANWCGPCKSLYPALRELQQSPAGKNLAVLTVMADREAKTVLDAIAAMEITWAACWDGEDGPIATRWNVQHYPTIYLIDQKGDLRGVDVPPGAVADMAARLAGSSK
jgi:thiol-disulfide isomerase/thioredoxin